MGEYMEILARIPALPEQPAAEVVEETALPRRRTGSLPPWILDSRSILALAVCAAALWSLAAWQEQARLAQQRRSARIAVQPPSLVAPETVTP
jgi:hypothetical protein